MWIVPAGRLTWRIAFIWAGGSTTVGTMRTPASSAEVWTSPKTISEKMLLRPQSQPQLVPRTDPCASWMAATAARAAWRCSTCPSGEPCVTTPGTSGTSRWCAGSWAAGAPGQPGGRRTTAQAPATSSSTTSSAKVTSPPCCTARTSAGTCTTATTRKMPAPSAGCYDRLRAHGRPETPGLTLAQTAGNSRCQRHVAWCGPACWCAHGTDVCGR